MLTFQEYNVLGFNVLSMSLWVCNLVMTVIFACYLLEIFVFEWNDMILIMFGLF